MAYLSTSQSQSHDISFSAGFSPLEPEMTILSGTCPGLAYLTHRHQRMERADKLSLVEVGGRCTATIAKRTPFLSSADTLQMQYFVAEGQGC